jgi:hypothetical protein
MSHVGLCRSPDCETWVSGQDYCFACTENGAGQPQNAHYVRACECGRGTINNHSDGVCLICAAEYAAVADW